jgi:hypothetical protein
MISSERAQVLSEPVPIEIQVSSVGKAGEFEQRSNGRGYLTESHVITSETDFMAAWEAVRRRCQNESLRRAVYRAVVSESVAQELIRNQNIPLEVIVPLSDVDTNRTDYLVMVAENAHHSSVEKWPEVFGFFATQSETRSPSVQLQEVLNITDQLNQARFALVSTPELQDAQDLAVLWFPFGWTLGESGTKAFIEGFAESGIYFSGIRDMTTGRLVAACIAEQLTIAGQVVVESTEWGVNPNYRGHRLGTAAVAFLNAQILHRTYQNNDPLPLIFAETNASSGAYRVAAHVGMRPPLWQLATPQTPIQMIRQNVDVWDGQGLSPSSPDQASPQYQTSFGENYAAWRDFVFCRLDQATIATHYSPEQVTAIMNLV